MGDEIINGATPEVADVKAEANANANGVIRVVNAKVKQTENKVDYVLFTLDNGVNVATWPNELESLLTQDQNMALAQAGLDKFCYLLKSAKVDIVEDGENYVITAINIVDPKGLVDKLVEKFIESML